MTEEDFKSNKNLVRQIECTNLFSPEECRNIISSCSKFTQINAEIAGNVADKSIRETKVRYLNANQDVLWIWDRINFCIMQTNKTYYNFDITGLVELQLLEYDEGCFYDWHVDITEDLKIASRKLSIILFLSDKNDYDGGFLNFDLLVQGTPDYKVEQGSMIIFPSFQAHKVFPVTRGKRFTLVGWAHGNVFK